MLDHSHWIPKATIGVAALHLAYAVVKYHGVYGDLISDGVFNSIGDHDDRTAAMWYLIAAPALATIGATAHWAVRRTGEIPAAIGGGLIAIGSTIAITDPIGGGWLVAALGIAVLTQTRRMTRTTIEAVTSKPVAGLERIPGIHDLGER